MKNGKRLVVMEYSRQDIIKAVSTVTWKEKINISI